MPPQVSTTVNEDGTSPTTTQNLTQVQSQESQGIRQIPRNPEDIVLSWQAPPDYETTEDNAVFIAGEPPLPPVPPPSLFAGSTSLLSINDGVQNTNATRTGRSGTGIETSANTIGNAMSSLSLTSSAGATVDTSSIYRAINESTPSTVTGQGQGQIPLPGQSLSFPQPQPLLTQPQASTWSPPSIDPITWQGLLARASNNLQSSALPSQPPASWQALALANTQAQSNSPSLQHTPTPLLQSQPQPDSTTTWQDLVLAQAEFNSSPHTPTTTTTTFATEHLPTYIEAQTPRMTLTYTFSPKEDDPTSMILIPPLDALDSRPVYHIRVTQDLFDPTFWITTIKRGGRANGKLVADFVTRPGALSLDELMHFKGEETLIFKKLLAGRNDKWHWMLNNVRTGSLMWKWEQNSKWECQHITDKERVKSKQYKIIAEFTPSYVASRNPAHRATRGLSERLAMLTIHPKEGYQFFDEIIVSVLILERKRRK